MLLYYVHVLHKLYRGAVTYYIMSALEAVQGHNDLLYHVCVSGRLYRGAVTDRCLYNGNGDAQRRHGPSHAAGHQHGVRKAVLHAAERGARSRPQVSQNPLCLSRPVSVLVLGSVGAS